MTKKYIISFLCILFAYVASSSAQSGYVGEFVYLSAPSVYGTIDGAAWSSNSNKVTVSGNHYGAQVLIHEYFTGSVTVECLYNYSYYSGGKKQYVTSQRAYYTISCLSSKISLNKKEVTLKPWETVELSYTNSSGYELPFSVWTTSDENVAVINSWEKEVYCQQTVEITAKGPGKCKITCDGHCGGAPVTCTINVVSIPPTSISVTPENIQLTAKKTANLKYTLEPSDAYAQITWTSSNESIAKVNTSGKITGVSEGVAIITATTDNGLSASCSVEVLPLPTSISLVDNVTIPIGYSIALQPKVYPENAVSEYNWTSSDPTVASINNGKIYGRQEGTAVITAKSDNGLSASCNVTVSTPVEGMDYKNVGVRCKALKALLDKSLKNIK